MIIIDNLRIFNEVKTVPPEACKTIQAGRLKGMTDINPMWRLKKMTELFGVCGFGWYYEITKQWLEQGADNTIVAFVNVNLYIKDSTTNEWSKPITGTGGNTFIAKESKGLYTSDECYKMALTDALSVACKSIGVGADVYMGCNDTKYTKYTDTNTTYTSPKAKGGKYICEVEGCGYEFVNYTTKQGKTYTPQQMVAFAKNKAEQAGIWDGVLRCPDCLKKETNNRNMRG